MVVGLSAANDAHLAVAHALAGVWTLLSPTEQQAVAGELAQWNNANHCHSTAEEHLQHLQSSLAGKIRPDAKPRLLAARLDPCLLAVLYDAVSKLVFALYGMTPPKPIPLEVVGAGPDPIYQGPIPICAGGAGASYGRDLYTKRLSAKVFLLPASLGPPSLASIPYLLCHELASHVFQGADHDTEDPFAEGWMDSVALSLHQDWAQVFFPWAPEFAREQARDLSTLKQLNLSGLTRGEPVMRAARRQGYRAADTVNEILSRYDTVGGPPSLFHQLSIELNLVRCTVGQRLNFVSAVEAAGRGTHAKHQATDADSRLAYQLSRRLRDWIKGKCDAAAVLCFAE
jgi:hypothetical protein